MRRRRAREALLPHLTAALDRLGGVLRPPAFAPEALDRTFRIAATDVQALLLGPPLLASIRAQAPRASLSFLAIQANVRERIETGDIDLAFAVATTPLPPGAYSEPLAEDRLALVVRRGARPLDKPWTLAEYAAATHATVSIFGDRLSEIDAELAEAGLVRRIVFTSPHFLATLAAVGASDCVDDAVGGAGAPLRRSVRARSPRTAAASEAPRPHHGRRGDARRRPRHRMAEGPAEGGGARGLPRLTAPVMRPRGFSARQGPAPGL